MLIANPNRDRTSRPDPFQPADFFASLPRVERQPQSEEELAAAIAAALGTPFPAPAQE